jgi:hypothetical protein
VVGPRDASASLGCAMSRGFTSRWVRSESQARLPRLRVQAGTEIRHGSGSASLARQGAWVAGRSVACCKLVLCRTGKLARSETLMRRLRGSRR